MSVSRTVLRAIAFEGGDPGTVLSKVNLVLSRDNAESMFVTIFYAVLDLQTGVLSFSSAGHDDGLLLTRANACEPLRYMGPAIGLVETVDYPTETRSLSSGDTLLLTDGITEAFNIDGRVFGPDSVVKSATQTQYTSAVDLVQSINDEVGRFSAGTVQSDDITCVGLRFKGRTLCT
jgi:serine phosphatase RsbU (regulator of sigma subunit)